MADRSFASRRSDSGLILDFPAVPVFGAEQPSFGFILIGGNVDMLPLLRPTRDRLAAIWQSQIISDGQEQPVLIILFSEPTDIAHLRLGKLLRLSSSQGRSLTSFAVKPLETVSAADDTDPANLTVIDVWWNGKRQQIKLVLESRLSLAGLWTMPEIHIHAPLRPEVEAREYWAEQAPQNGAEILQPKQFQISIKGKAEIAFEGALDRERQLDERTRLSSIGAQIWGKLTGRKMVQGEGQAQEEGPSILANMAGWLMWHTPLGVPLARQFAERMKLVERLMASGDVDSALRLALRLGSGDTDGRKKVYPTKLSGMRTALDFNISDFGLSAPIIRNNDYFSLQEQYTQLAERLERDGDFKRAAYIRAQLQGNHFAAVLTLARGEMFLDAAKLAMDAKLAPVLIVEMFYKAGEHATAIAIATREDCFDQLAEESRKKDPEFHAYVLRAWTDRLIETNQHLRALQVTDFLANQTSVDPNLIERRLTWIDTILSDSQADTASPEAVARALLSAPWTDQAQALTAFAQDCSQNTESFEASALDAVHGWIRNDDERLSILFDELSRMANQQSASQMNFWKLAAPIIIERISLALIAHSAGVLSQNQKGGLQALLRMARAEVLVTDLNKLKLQGHNRIPNQYKWTLPPATVHSPPVLRGCLVGNDALLVWRESGLLQLLDQKGRILWQGNVSNVEALVPVGLGSDVLVIQQTETGKLLSRFSTSRRAFFAIGQISLTAYHDIASEGQWLVQIGEQIGALDLAKLCAPQPELEFLWASKLTASVEVVSFLQENGHPQWLTRDISDTRRNGLYEAWYLLNGRTLQTLLVSMEIKGKVDAAQVRSWYWDGGYAIRPTINSGWAATSSLWTLEQENKNCELRQTEYAHGQFYTDQFLSCDQSRATVAIGTNHVECKSNGHQKRSMTVNTDSETTMTCLARGTCPSIVKGHGSDRSHIILLAANDGRIIFVDLNVQKVTSF
jgi:hypothetical protein